MKLYMDGSNIDVQKFLDKKARFEASVGTFLYMETIKQVEKLKSCKKGPKGSLICKEEIYINQKDILIYLIDITIIDRHGFKNQGSNADSTFAHFEYCTYGGTNFKR